MKILEIIAKAGRSEVRLIRYDDDPCSWIVRKYRPQFLWKRCVHSAWFFSEQQARSYAKKLIAEPSAGGGK